MNHKIKVEYKRGRNGQSKNNKELSNEIDIAKPTDQPAKLRSDIGDAKSSKSNKEESNEIDKAGNLGKLDDQVKPVTFDDTLLDKAKKAGEQIEIDDDHFVKEGRKQYQKLKDNVVYKAKDNEYYYETDNYGRIIEAAALDVELRERRGAIGYIHDLIKGIDHRGHIFARSFNGSNRMDNVLAMNGSLNLNQYKQIEDEIRNHIKAGGTAKMSVKMIYNKDNKTKRPDGFEVRYQLSNEDPVKKEFDNPKRLIDKLKKKEKK